MLFPEFCIKRPAFTIVINLVIILVGMLAFANLSLRWLPNIDMPMVTIDTNYPGASAQAVEQDITSVIEQNLTNISGIDSISSSSMQGQSQIMVTFKAGSDVNAVIADIRSNLDAVRGLLPKDAESPVLSRANMDDTPLIVMAFRDSKRTPEQLSDFISNYIAPQFGNINGVGNVSLQGERLSALRVRLNPSKMAAAHLSVPEVLRAIQSQNASVPSGQIRGKDRFYTLVLANAAQNVAAFNKLIVSNQDHHLIRLEDIGRADIEPLSTDTAFRVNGEGAVGLNIVSQSSANPLTVASEVENVVAKMQTTLPSTMHMRIYFNQADYIRDSLHSVYEALAEAILCVWIVIFIFLGNFRSTLVPIFTIPVCLIGTCFFLYILNFSINVITLMAFVLAIGLVVDDAIVMLENIARHIEQGEGVLAAAINGSKEIVFAILAMTITLVAVYAPIAFTPGMLGILFKEFSFTLAAAVLISGFVSLTLSPMMCSKILKTKKPNRYQIFFEHYFYKLQQGYGRLLKKTLLHKKWIFLFLMIIGSMGLALYKMLPSELAPNEDTRQLYVIVSAPRSASFQYTNKIVEQLEAIEQKNSNIDSYTSLVGMGMPSRAVQLIKLKKPFAGGLSTQQLADYLANKGNQLAEGRVFVMQPSSPLARSMGNEGNFGVAVLTTSDYLRLHQVTENILNIMRQNPHFLYLHNKLKWDTEGFEIDIDQEKAADLGVSWNDITDSISTLIAGRTLGKLNNMDIVVQLKEALLQDPNLLQAIYIKNQDGEMLPLTDFVTIKNMSSPQVLRHYDRQRADFIYLALNPDYSVAKAIQSVENLMRTDLPDDMSYTFLGEAQSFLESNAKTAFTFVLALVFIYLVLVAQFESFIDPLIVLFTVPFAIAGAFCTLYLFNGSLNIYSNIGLITLIGLIAKHGILITDFANRLKQSGHELMEAVVEAATLRLRPILMTTAAMVLGAMPLAFATGPGAAPRAQIGLVIVGGLMLGTVFSLFVVPVAYTLLNYLKREQRLMTK